MSISAADDQDFVSAFTTAFTAHSSLLELEVSVCGPRTERLSWADRITDKLLAVAYLPAHRYTGSTTAGRQVSVHAGASAQARRDQKLLGRLLHCNFLGPLSTTM